MSIVLLFQHHAVVIDHTVRGNDSSAAIDQQPGSFDTVQVFQFLHRGIAAIQIHKMAVPYGLQVREVGDDCGLLAAVCQVDKVFDIS